jgi:hypothetical protein
VGGVGRIEVAARALSIRRTAIALGMNVKTMRACGRALRFHTDQNAAFGLLNADDGDSRNSFSP